MRQKIKMAAFRGIDVRTLAEFKAKAVEEGLPVGKALNHAMEFWVHAHRKKPKMSMAKFKPFRWQKGAERLSEQVDEIVYGGD